MNRDELSIETLVRYAQGEMTRSESEETERLVADSRRAQKRLAELRAMMDELRRPPAWVATQDLVGELRGRIARGEVGLPEPVERRARRWVLAGGAAALAVAAVGVLATPHTHGGGDRDGDGGTGGAGREASPGLAPELVGVRRKGGPSGAPPDRWVGVKLARLGPDGTPDVLASGAQLGPGELEVWYTNLGPQPYAYLMVFAVDRTGRVSWLYPAHEEEGTAPAAITIERGVADVLLPDLIEHDFAAGRLAVCGLFLRQPLTVVQVEAALGGQQPAPGHRLPFPSSGQHCFDLEAR